ncbi:MAG TPA: outer membrane beta-barrel protein [Vicinamibacterales bacterium]|nr:outer membrane beta-barrel protein [Vicinamibacterales bacterium]
MKQVVMGVVMLCLGGGASARAQAPAPAADQHVFAQVDGGVTFGGTTSSVVQVEGGYRALPGLELFGEIGRMQDLAPHSTATRAGIIVGYLNRQGKGPAAATVHMPALYGAIGARYFLPAHRRLEPYLLAAVGLARTSSNVRFSLGGADITGQMPAYGVQLGSDLSGSQTNALVALGLGATLPWRAIYFDGAIRYHRIFAAPAGINVGSATFGVGYRF